MTETTVKSRAEWLAKFAREHGTDCLLDVIYEARVGVSHTFSNEAAMDTVVRTARKMLEEKGEGIDNIQ